MATRLLVLMSLVFLFGCALTEINNDLKTREEILNKKEAELSLLEQENQQLYLQKEQLVQKLNLKTMTLDQLNSNLNTLIQQNTRLIQLKKVRHENITALENEVSELQKRQAAITKLSQQTGDPNIKEAKIKSLQDEIRNYLLLGLKSKYR